ncbi:helix-turn-helix transcriptional regulator [Aquella oligotrophica]|uniref:HTH luxR-type domain-containing protein n=1 Tax=Aquella oligotrophica TaxID=2067065 RepID=A0A2I7N773_9NEIS|nr:hypothetical protein [Aquella oligotrophica]AUR52323.1 hypothetical protein CUN60_08450 [Aquella oligotrophica]
MDILQKNNMADENFFKTYCESAKVLYNSGEKEKVLIKNKNLEIVYISIGYEDTYGVTLESLTGGKLSEEKKIIYEKERITALEQDKIIRDTRQAREFIFIDAYYHISHVYKRPIINPATNNFVGIFVYIHNYVHPNLLKLIYKINGVNSGLSNIKTESLKYKLTKKQNMILFLYLNRFSNSEISEIMTTLGHKISKARVNDHLENLKLIFHARSKNELIEKAVALNYHLLIPRAFLKSGSYEFDSNMIISG